MNLLRTRVRKKFTRTPGVASSRDGYRSRLPDPRRAGGRLRHRRGGRQSPPHRRRYGPPAAADPAVARRRPGLPRRAPAPRSRNVRSSTDLVEPPVVEPEPSRSRRFVPRPAGSRRGSAFTGAFAGVLGRGAITDGSFDDLEEALLRADVGVARDGGADRRVAQQGRREGDHRAAGAARRTAARR